MSGAPDLGALVELMPFAARLGIVLEHADPGDTPGARIVLQTDLLDADARRVAQVTQTQAVLGGADSAA